eukprot:scaffold32051_cov50-Phaeocystis_antarctica.AAC.2
MRACVRGALVGSCRARRGQGTALLLGGPRLVSRAKTVPSSATYKWPVNVTIAALADAHV